MSNNNRMDRANWQYAAEQILNGAPAGAEVSMTTLGLASHPHNGHVDGWGAVKQSDGSVRIEKGHYE